jgi:putative FmdB family regulatory protein
VPLYEYLCRNCHTQFEKLVFNSQSEVVCKNCGSPDITQLLSTFAVGSGSGRSVPQEGPCSTCGAAQRGECGMM